MFKPLLLSAVLLFPAYAQVAPAPHIEIRQVRLSEKAAAERLKTKVAPIYPEKAREKKLEGKVVVGLRIDKQGNVTHAKAYTGPDELRYAAVAAVMQWKYEPIKTSLGDAVDVETLATVEFVLKKK